MRGFFVGSIVAASVMGLLAFALFGRDAPSPPPRARPIDAELTAQLSELLPLIEAANKATRGDKTDAIALARAKAHAIETNHGDDANVPFWRGIIEIMAHREADAQAAYGRLCSLAPLGAKDQRACYLRSIHVIEFDPAHAAESVVTLRAIKAQAPTFMPEPVDRALFRALILFHFAQIEKGENDRAVDSCKEAIAVAGKHSELVMEGKRALAYTFGNANRWFEAEKAWRELVDLSKGGMGVPRYHLAGALAVQSKMAEAEAEYTAVLDLVAKGREPAEDVPLLSESRLRRGNCRRVLGKYPEALDDIETYLREVPTDYRAEYWLAVVLIDGFNKPAEAEPHLLKAYDAAPFCDNYLHLLVKLYEILAPDPAKAAPLRRKYDTEKDARTAERERRVKAGVYDGFVCDNR